MLSGVGLLQTKLVEVKKAAYFRVTIIYDDKDEEVGG